MNMGQIGSVLTGRNKMETNKTKEFIIRRDCFGNIYTQTELIRCKDCKHGYPLTDSAYYQCTLAFRTSERHERDWFCADGERQEGR